MRKLTFVFLLFFLVLACQNNIIESKTKANCILWGKINAIKDFDDCIKFLGEIKNIGQAIAEYVKITFTMYDSSNMVIGTAFTFTKPTDLNPNQIGTFECLTEIKKTKVFKWKYVIEWYD